MKAEKPTEHAAPIPSAAALRRRAEEQLQGQSPAAPAALSALESQQHLVHELHVHEIELEMQNEELRAARRVAEDALDRYTDLYDFAPVAYFTLRSNGEIVRANLAGASLLGRERDRLMGMRLGVFLTEGTLTTFNALLLQVFTDETRQGCEVEVRHNDQSPRIVQIEATLSADRQECHAVLLDLTERREGARALARAHEFTLGTLNALSAHLCVLDNSGKIIAVNRAWAEFYERNRLPTQPAQDFIGTDYFSVCLNASNASNASDASGVEAHQISDGIRQVLVGERSNFSLEYPCHSPTEQRWFLARVTRFSGENGNDVVVAHENITERKRAEQWQQHYSHVLALISAESPLAEVLDVLARFVEQQADNASCCLLLLDADGEHLVQGAAPSLPDYFRQAIDGIELGDKGGACGVVAQTGVPVIIADTLSSSMLPVWRELTAKAGLRACWSVPVFSAERKVVGTFAVYHRKPWSPTPDDEELVRRSASLAALAIDRAQHQEAQQLAKTVFEENAEGVMVTSPNDRILTVNPAFERLTGYSLAEVVGQQSTVLDSGQHDEAFWAAIRAQLARTGRWEGDVWNRRKNGENYLIRLSVADVRNDAGAIGKRISIMKDMNLQMVQAARIEQLAFYDALTGLPNRALFMDRIENILASAERRGDRGAILFMDLDRFKEINDSKGHAIGDLALAEIARRFLTVVRREETLARLGGDEFVLIAEGADNHSAALVASRLLQSLSEPLILMGAAHSMGMSIGIALYPDDGTTVEELIKHADIAMYRAKVAGGGYRFYQAEMSTDLEKHLGIAQRLGAAMQANQLQLYYQPKIELATGKLVGAEALLRWHDADHGWISPAEFIPIAEQRGMMSKLGDWVLRKACMQLTEWRNCGTELPGRLSVNVSARQLEDREVVARMLEIVHEEGATSAWLELELTESSMMSDPELSIQIMDNFSAAGFGLSIDDFGTGYSSLAYLKRFAADEVKIDISFVRNMLTDPGDYNIVSTIIAMAHGFGMTTAAEGVEVEGQAEALKALNCDLAQGYLYSRPEAPNIFAEKWLGPDRA